MIYVSYYFVRLFSSGLDDTAKADSYDAAVKQARARIKQSSNGSAHAVITERGQLVATVTQSRGRVITKRAKGLAL